MFMTNYFDNLHENEETMRNNVLALSYIETATE